MQLFLKKITTVILALVIFLSFTTAGNVYVQAQPNIGFTECNFSGQDGRQGPTLIQNCLRSVFTFSFVVGLFLIAFRVGFDAIDDYNPFSNGNSGADAIKTITEVSIGLILIGGPVLFLNTVNTSLLNFNFLDLGGITAGQNRSGNPSSPTTPSTPPNQFNTTVTNTALGGGGAKVTIGTSNIGTESLNSALGTLGFTRNLFGNK